MSRSEHEPVNPPAPPAWPLPRAGGCVGPVDGLPRGDVQEPLHRPASPHHQPAGRGQPPKPEGSTPSMLEILIHTLKRGGGAFCGEGPGGSLCVRGWKVS